MISNFKYKCPQGRSQPHSPGWARVPLSSFFLKILINFSYFFPQTLLIFFLIMVLRVGESPTREGPGYATECPPPPGITCQVGLKLALHFQFTRRYARVRRRGQNTCMHCRDASHPFSKWDKVSNVYNTFLSYLFFAFSVFFFYCVFIFAATRNHPMHAGSKMMENLKNLWTWMNI